MEILTVRQECQDLRKLVAIVEDFAGQRRKELVDHTVEPPVHVVVKYPCVALRYPTSPTLVSSVARRALLLCSSILSPCGWNDSRTLTGLR
jgi:hypothetical protein